MPNPKDSEVTVVMLPDGTFDTADNVQTVTMPESVYDALIAGSTDEKPMTDALAAYIQKHGSFLSE